METAKCEEGGILTIRIRLGSLYLILTVDPSGRTSITANSLSYLCRPQRTTDVLLELSWAIWVWSSEACSAVCAWSGNTDWQPVWVNTGQIDLPVHTYEHHFHTHTKYTVNVGCTTVKTSFRDTFRFTSCTECMCCNYSTLV